MTHKQYQQLIDNSIRDYRTAKLNGDKNKIEMAINRMENVFICVSPWKVKGTEKLRQTILKAKGLA